MRLIVAGSRDFVNFPALKVVMDGVKRKLHGKMTVLCGCARGADILGYQWAKQRGVEVEKYPADWARYKKTAGMVRNREMAAKADGLIAFWDGESRGTKHMITKMKEMGKPVKVYDFDGNLLST